MSNFETFELRRQSDSLVYTFKREFKDGQFAYKRQDADLWITFDEKLGWVAMGNEDQTLMGRVWDILPKDQLDYPPAGIWVSRKEDRSYVYDLVYI